MGDYVPASTRDEIWDDGSITRVDDANPGEIAGTNVILEKWTEVTGIIYDLRNMLIGDGTIDSSGYFQDMLDNIAEYDLPENWDAELLNKDNVALVIESIDPLVEAGRVIINPFDPDFNPDDFPTDKPILGKLTYLEPVDTSYTEPDDIEDINVGMDFTEDPYISNLHDLLYSKLYGDLNDGDALAGSSAVEDALWARGRDRQRQSNAREWDKGMAAVGASGFNFAGGGEAGVLLSISNELSQQDENLNNDIIIKMAELALQHNQFLITESRGLEALLREFHNNVQNRSLDYAKAFVDFALRKYQAQIDKYKAQWQGIRDSLSAKIDAAELVIKSNQVTAQIYDTEAKVFQTEIDLVVQRLKAEIDEYEAYIKGQDIKMRENAEWWKALTDQQKSKVAEQEVKLRQVIEHAKLLVESSLSVNQIRDKILESLVNTAAQVLSSALAAVNTSVNHQTSKSEGRTESWNHGEQLNESHNFNETPGASS